MKFYIYIFKHCRTRCNYNTAVLTLTSKILYYYYTIELDLSYNMSTEFTAVTKNLRKRLHSPRFGRHPYSECCPWRRSISAASGHSTSTPGCG